MYGRFAGKLLSTEEWGRHLRKPGEEGGVDGKEIDFQKETKWIIAEVEEMIDTGQIEKRCVRQHEMEPSMGHL